MKRVFVLLLTAAVLLGALQMPAAAAAVSGSDAAEALAALGLLQGTGNGFELDRSATRAEALTLLLRLLGQEQAALDERDACPFEDGGWAAQRITYAWKNGLVKGQSDTRFGSDERVGARDWLTMLLRALGYSEEKGDFSWAQSIAFADSIGLSHGEYTAAGTFLREDMVRLAYNALALRGSGEETTLAEQLYRDGVVSGSALRATRLSGVLPDGDKPVYTGTEIHDLFAPAVFYVEIYQSEESLAKDKPESHGSGFFITADGVAALCYHELDGAYALRATTLDGRRYDLTGVLFYDVFWDAAVVRISRTDLDGNTVSCFPYLELGDSDAAVAGERIYTLSNSLGLVDNITDGMVSNASRNVDDPDYLYIQHSAPVSDGSSGGALLNCHGEAIGIQYATFINGVNMHLAVPVNVISDVPLTGDGTPLPQVKETEDAVKAAAVVVADQTELALEYGDEVEVIISHTGGPRAILRFDIDDWDVVECAWGDFFRKRTIPLTVKAVGDGEAEITISFADENGGEDSDIVIHVTVTGTPVEPEEEPEEELEEELEEAPEEAPEETPEETPEEEPLPGGETSHGK